MSDTAKDLSPHLTRDSYRHSRSLVWLGIWLLLGIHAGLLAYSAARHSPTVNEPAHLIAGISNWKFRRFELYRVDPPLTRMIGALPVLAAGCETDWSGYFEGPGARPVFSMGRRFIAVNGQRSIWLFTIARWACIPISLAGGLASFLWARELYGSTSGFFALTLWCFSPNILAHAELVTPDAAATSFGILAGYTFWRWLKFPTWSRAAIAGFALGLAEISKMSWVILFGLWPLLWLFWLATTEEREWKTWLQTAIHLFLILLVGLYVLNLTYLFDGSFTQAKDFTFVSSTLTGNPKKQSGSPGNRFRDTLFGKIPVPVPKQHLLGVDVQKHDLEDCDQPSYLRGEWKDGGWWYYYLYGLCVKVPHGTQLLFALAVLATMYMKWRSWQDEVVLLAPAIALFVLISSQLEYNHHFRYVLPSVGLSLIFLSKTTCPFRNRHATSNIDSDSVGCCSPISQGQRA